MRTVGVKTPIVLSLLASGCLYLWLSADPGPLVIIPNPAGVFGLTNVAFAFLVTLWFPMIPDLWSMLRTIHVIGFTAGSGITAFMMLVDLIRLADIVEWRAAALSPFSALGVISGAGLYWIYRPHVRRAFGVHA